MAGGRIPNFPLGLGRHRAFVDSDLRPANAPARASGIFRRFRFVLAHQLVAGADDYQWRRRDWRFARAGVHIINCRCDFHRSSSRFTTDDLRDSSARQKLVDAVAASGRVDFSRLSA